MTDYDRSPIHRPMFSSFAFPSSALPRSIMSKPRYFHSAIRPPCPPQERLQQSHCVKKFLFQRGSLLCGPQSNSVTHILGAPKDSAYRDEHCAYDTCNSGIQRLSTMRRACPSSSLAPSSTCETMKPHANPFVSVACLLLPTSKASQPPRRSKLLNISNARPLRSEI